MSAALAQDANQYHVLFVTSAEPYLGQPLVVVLTILSFSQWCRLSHNETRMVRRRQLQTKTNRIEHGSWLTIEPRRKLALALCI
jgi:hypothetical protein